MLFININADFMVDFGLEAAWGKHEREKKQGTRNGKKKIVIKLQDSPSGRKKER